MAIPNRHWGGGVVKNIKIDRHFNYLPPSLIYCFFQATDGFLHIPSALQNAHTFSVKAREQIFGLLDLQPCVCVNVSFGFRGALKL